MSVEALPYPDVVSLASILQDDQGGSLRAVVTVRPFDGPVTRSEQFVRLGATAGLLQEVVGDGVIGEHRVGPATFTSLDPTERYLLMRREAVADDMAGLFNHLAGPVAFAYLGTSGPAWRRITRDARITFYRPGAMRLRAAFDARTRLPVDASTEFGHIHWDYERHAAPKTVAPALRGWRLEELAVHHVVRGYDPGADVPIRTVQRPVMAIEESRPAFNPVDRLVRELLGGHVYAQGTFRTTTMDKAQEFADWTPIHAEAPVLRLAIDDVEPFRRTDPFTGPDYFLRQVRAGGRVGRLWTSEPQFVDLGIHPRDRPIELEPDATSDESADAWRSRVTRTAEALVDQARLQ